MHDCSNAEIRDLLPDLLHGRLDAETRAQVEAHVARCADCAAELSVLRDLRAAMHTAPSENVASIVAAIPAHRPNVRQTWVGWRVAAAVTLLVGGASSVVVIREGTFGQPDSVRAVMASVPDAQPIAPVPSVVDTHATPLVAKPHVALVTPAPAPVQQTLTVAAQPAARELALGGSSLNDLSDRELAALLKAIDELDAVPSTDVETGSLAPVSGRRGPSR